MNKSPDYMNTWETHNMKLPELSQLLAGLVSLVMLTPALAADEVHISIKNHRFEPSVITIPADTKVKLIVKNEDATPEEFESYELHREKVVRGNSQITIYVGPLQPGTYPFFGEFNQQTAQGRLIVK